MEPKILILTGPPGAGKSTIGEILANKLEKTALIHTDYIRHMIKNGKSKFDDENWKDQIILGAKNTCSLAKNFYKKGFNVILDDVLSSKYVFNAYYSNLKKLEPKFILLLPNKDVLKNRDLARGKEAMKERAILLHDKFTSFIQKEKRFHVIDSSNHSPEETANKIMEMIK